MSDDLRLSLGAYLLGALSPVDRADVQAHLTACRTCRDELATLAGLPGLLARLDPATLATDADLDPHPDPGLLDRTLVELTRQQRGQVARRRLSAVAASVILLAAGAAGGVVLTQLHDPGRVVSSNDPGTGATASFSLHAKAWGTEIGVRLRHVPAGTHCRLLTTDRNGRRQTIGAWQADYEGTAHISAATDLPPGQLALLEVATSQDRRLVSVTLT